MEYGVKAATDIYDEARFRERLGLPFTTKKFAAIAKVCVKDLTDEIAAGIKPQTNNDCIRVINKYLISYFGNYHLENINSDATGKYEIWRNNLLKKASLASTLTIHASAYRSVISTAIQKGWISEHTPIAQMKRTGAKGRARPAFTREEVNRLLDYLPIFAKGEHSRLAKESRQVCRDYVEILLGTGMRSGIESQHIKWSDISLHIDSVTAVKYLRIGVTGKAGGRYLIAKHNIKTVLERVIAKYSQLNAYSLDRVLELKPNLYLFSLSDDMLSVSFCTTFKHLMTASGLLKDSATGQNRTLYSLRHTLQY
ncbi:MAG: integrase [Betaproteobacteria bacterium]|nr:integrase [Betaproteobacteria bacterium]